MRIRVRLNEQHPGIDESGAALFQFCFELAGIYRLKRTGEFEKVSIFTELLKCTVKIVHKRGMVNPNCGTFNLFIRRVSGTFYAEYVDRTAEDVNEVSRPAYTGNL